MEAILNDAVCENVYVKIPQSDVDFFQIFAKKMGWWIENKTDLLDKYIHSRPKNVDLTDDGIMAEVRAVRYAQ
jgi:hypothetical protein